MSTETETEFRDRVPSMTELQVQLEELMKAVINIQGCALKCVLVSFVDFMKIVQVITYRRIPLADLRLDTGTCTPGGLDGQEGLDSLDGKDGGRETESEPTSPTLPSFDGQS